MAFFTDLDRTIIFSKRFIGSNDDDIVLAERDGEKEIAYITFAGLEALKDLSKKTTVVPVTTRNLAEYKRIHILNELNLKYYIVNNGAEIYIDGKTDKTFSDMIRKELGLLSYGFDVALQKFLNAFDLKTIKLYRLSDNYLWVIVVNPETFDFISLMDFKKAMLAKGWQISVTGKKVYIIPSCISKWNAVKYLHDNYLNEQIISAGDSYMDIEMVKNSEISFIPRGCELENLLPQSFITKSSGIRAGEEILTVVQKIITNT
jgi:hydroxymethylpyrimidine pyrophosphatase-like HAD family hydrolase